MAEKKPKRPAKPRKLHLAFKDREYFVENLGMLMQSAVPVGEALASLQTTAHSRAMQRALKRMQTDIDAGYSLADALERTGIVSRQTLALVRLGEASGHLVENLELAAQQEEKRHTFQAKVRSALIYPVFVMVLTVIVALAVAWFLLPKLAVTFSQVQVSLPPISKVMISGGVFLREHGVIAVPLFLAFMALVGYILFVAPPTRHIGQRILFSLPGIGRLMREVEVAQFGYLLGTLLNAGLSITQALNLLADASAAQQYQRFYQALAVSLGDGYSFRESLGRYRRSGRLLPPSVQQMVIAGERTGSLPKVLTTIGRTYEQKSNITTSNLEAIIEPILLVIVWVGVMLVAVAVIVPIYSLLGGLQ